MPQIVSPAGQLQSGLAVLLQAFDFARGTASNPWDFAVERSVLYDSGLSHNDLRWLLASRFAEHGIELPPGDNERRSVRTVKSFQFHGDSCFILSVAGADFARSRLLDHQQHHPAELQCEPDQDSAAHSSTSGNLRWNRETRRVIYGGVPCIELTRAAENLETVLEAFEKTGWATQIHDPFPQDKSGNRKRRLHNTINALNRCQSIPRIHFSSADSGHAIRWTPWNQFVAPPTASTRKTSEKRRVKRQNRVGQKPRRKRR